jgi:hypothetical protein
MAVVVLTYDTAIPATPATSWPSSPPLTLAASRSLHCWQKWKATPRLFARICVAERYYCAPSIQGRCTCAPHHFPFLDRLRRRHYTVRTSFYRLCRCGRHTADQRSRADHRLRPKPRLAAVSGVIGSILGTTRSFISANTVHQAPPVGGLCACIIAGER